MSNNNRLEQKQAKVVSSALGLTDGGHEQLCITFKTIEEKPETVSYYQMFETDTNIDFARKALSALGWDPDANGWKIEELHQTAKLVGKECSIAIAEEEYEDRSGNWKKSRKVKYVNAGGGGLKNVMSSQDAKTFGSRLRARLMGGGAPAQRHEQMVYAPAESFATQGDDDVPF